MTLVPLGANGDEPEASIDWRSEDEGSQYDPNGSE